MIQSLYKKFVVLDNYFLSSEECLDIKNKLLENKEKWQKSHVNYFNYFPLGLYLYKEYTSYQDNLKKYQSLMLNLFGTYYDKLLETLQNETQLKLSYHKNLNYPGFHISNGQSMNIPNFHTDGFYRFSSLLDKKEALFFGGPKYYSVIVVIDTLSNDQTSLLVRDSKETIHESRQLLVYDKEYFYTKGMLAIWDSDLKHSIKPFTPKHTNDYRITMQCHLAVTGDRGFIFW